MKIEKRKFTATTKWTNATTKGLAAMLGIAAATALSACNDDSSNPAGPATTPAEPTPTSSDAVTQPNEQDPSSSSQVIVDIPKSSETVDMELLSSSSSEQTIDPIDLEPLAGDAVVGPTEDPIANPDSVVSSSSQALSSSSLEETPVEPAIDTTNCILAPGSQSSHIYLCPINPIEPSETTTPDFDPSQMIVSMVTTFESIDIDV